MPWGSTQSTEDAEGSSTPAATSTFASDGPVTPEAEEPSFTEDAEDASSNMAALDSLSAWVIMIQHPRGFVRAEFCKRMQKMFVDFESWINRNLHVEAFASSEVAVTALPPSRTRCRCSDLLRDRLFSLKTRHIKIKIGKPWQNRGSFVGDFHQQSMLAFGIDFCYDLLNYVRIGRPWRLQDVARLYCIVCLQVFLGYSRLVLWCFVFVVFEGLATPFSCVTKWNITLCCVLTQNCYIFSSHIFRLYRCKFVLLYSYLLC